MEPQQLSLFGSAGIRPAATEAPAVTRARLCPAGLSDAALIEAIPAAGLADCQALTEEATRRRLRDAVPALEALCRRFRGFGLHQAIPEQVAALRALAAIGGAAAVETLCRLIVAQVVQGPALGEAVRAAAALHCRLPADVAVTLLRHADPPVRADACRCAPAGPDSVAVLLALLDELRSEVALAAACALGRMARPEARATLHRALRGEAASAEAIDALVPLADEESVVLLGRIARQQPALREAAKAALEDIDTPRAAAVLAGLAD